MTKKKVKKSIKRKRILKKGNTTGVQRKKRTVKTHMSVRREIASSLIPGKTNGWTHKQWRRPNQRKRKVQDSIRTSIYKTLRMQVGMQRNIVGRRIYVV